MEVERGTIEEGAVPATLLWRKTISDQSENITADDGLMLSDHAYLSLVIPPQNRIMIAVGLVCIAVVLAYFLVKALLYSAEHDAGL